MDMDVTTEQCDNLCYHFRRQPLDLIRKVGRKDCILSRLHENSIVD